jgi:hypothetical protein
MSNPLRLCSILALFLYLLSAGPINAQIERGTFFFNGTGNISLEKTHRALDEWDLWVIDELQGEIALQGGYLIGHSLAVGWNTNSRVHWEDESSGTIPEAEDRVATFSFGPLVRWYPLSKSVRIQPFLELGYTLVHTAKRTIVYYEAVPETTVKTKLRNSGSVFTLGTDWFLNRIIALEPTIYYAVLAGERQVKRPEVPAYNFTREEPASSFGFKLRLAIFFP